MLLCAAVFAVVGSGAAGATGAVGIVLDIVVVVIVILSAIGAFGAFADVGGFVVLTVAVCLVLALAIRIVSNSVEGASHLLKHFADFIASLSNKAVLTVIQTKSQNRQWFS